MNSYDRQRIATAFNTSGTMQALLVVLEMLYGDLAAHGPRTADTGLIHVNTGLCYNTAVVFDEVFGRTPTRPQWPWISCSGVWYCSDTYRCDLLGYTYTGSSLWSPMRDYMHHAAAGTLYTGDQYVQRLLLLRRCIRFLEQ